MSSLLLVTLSALLVYAQSVDSAPVASAGSPLKVALAAALTAASTEAPQPSAPPFSAGVRYDQRQTGNLNVQVDLKDVEIYAIFDDSLFGSLGDYEYDYSQLTERPSSATSSSSSSTPALSSSSNGTSTTKASANGEGVDGVTSARPITIFFTRKTVAEPPKSSLQSSSSGVNPPAVNTSLKIVTNDIAERRSSPSEDNDPQLRSNEQSASALLSSSVPSSTSTSRPAVVSTSPKPSVANRRCGAGFHRDASQRCRRNRRPLRNKNSSTKNGSSKSKSSSVPRTLGKDASSSASQQEQSAPPKPAPDNRETVHNQSTVPA